MKNIIRIRYCCFNLRLLSILAHFAQTVYSISFLSYGILRAFVCVCFVHVETNAHTHTQRERKRDVKKEPKSFIHSIQVKNRCNSLKPLCTARISSVFIHFIIFKRTKCKSILCCTINARFNISVVTVYTNKSQLI